MDTASLLLELYGRVPPLAAGAVDGISAEELCRPPAPGANTIGWLVWHLTRVQDHHVAELLGTEQIWVGGDWARRCGLEPDPSNTGYGHGPDEVRAVRPEGADVLLGYLAAVDTRTKAMLEGLTPEELAADLDVPPEALARTVREYNEAAARGVDPVFQKRAPYLQPIGVPPASGIGAIDLRVDHGAIYATFTLGGLVTDPDGAALDGAGHRIPGLYAVGRTAASLAAHHYASGMSLGDGSFFGRRAGRHGADRARAERSSLH